MKKYTKPEFIIEEFYPNVAVAACNREWNGEVDTSWPSQKITCCRNSKGSTTDNIFSSGTSSCYKPCHMIYISVGGTYSVSQLNEKGLAISGSGGSVTVPDGGGYVLCWDDGNHYGPATPEIVKIMTSSF